MPYSCSLANAGVQESQTLRAVTLDPRVREGTVRGSHRLLNNTTTPAEAGAQLGDVAN